ncbi:hypothetical protein EJ04DRAFT_340869 [Polyplosphaeria fusca]|uniref:Uncharacterized protein n=1 Tax=Polyplosphaeria fusca TaxID=682080 RepID=A0A9P4UZB2_9PLEO|nr:hypothetical protein EJ04DRAFT_340869 [Polyplosphaeria fusca]
MPACRASMMYSGRQIVWLGSVFFPSFFHLSLSLDRFVMITAEGGSEELYDTLGISRRGLGSVIV